MSQQLPSPQEIPEAESKLFDLSHFNSSLSTVDEKILLSPKRPWWKHRRWQIVIGAVILGLILLRIVSALFTGGPQMNYLYQRVTQGDLAFTVSATGPIQGKIYNATFSVGGRITEIDVKVSQRVTQGQTLAKVDTQLLQDNVNEAQTYVDQAKDSGNDAAIKSAQARLKTAQDTLSAATLTAPHAGVVTGVNGVVGSVVGAGGSPTVQISDDSAPQVQAFINEADIGNISVGLPVQFTVGAYGDQVFTGKVSNIASTGVTVSNVVTYPIAIDIDTSKLQDAVLRAGMTANVTIMVSKDSGVLLLPTSAVNIVQTAIAQNLITRDQVNANQELAKEMLRALGPAVKTPLSPACVLERDTNQWIVKPVLLGRTDGTYYEVVSGVVAGEVVVSDIQTKASVEPTHSKQIYA